jgi:hypothetical protein
MVCGAQKRSKNVQKQSNPWFWFWERVPGAEHADTVPTGTDRARMQNHTLHLFVVNINALFVAHTHTTPRKALGNIRW